MNLDCDTSKGGIDAVESGFLTSNNLFLGSSSFFLPLLLLFKGSYLIIPFLSPAHTLVF